MHARYTRDGARRTLAAGRGVLSECSHATDGAYEGLDVEHREPVDQQENSRSETPSARILVAEDHTDSRDALQALLEAHGYVVTIAVDGREAIERAQSVRPDLILMDIMMPVVDGLSATRELRR